MSAKPKPKPLLVADDVSYSYPGDSQPTVTNASVELYKGRVVGIFGVNACGKTTLAKCLNRKVEPSGGRVRCPATERASACGDDEGAALGGSVWPAWFFSALLLAVMAAGGFLAAPFATPLMRQHNIPVEPVVVCAGLLTLLIAFAVPSIITSKRTDSVARKAFEDYVTFATSEDSPGTKLPPDTTVEKVIGEHMAAVAAGDAKQRREAVISLLEESGFQRYNQETGEKEGTPRDYICQGLTMKECSGGQKQTIYILGQLAQAKPVLLCDEMMIGLDSERQGRLLRMLRRRRDGLAMLWITTDLHWLSVICTEPTDEVLYMDMGGVIVERRCGGREGGEMLSNPSHPKAKEYVQAFRSMLRDQSTPLGQAIEDERLKADYKIRKQAEKRAKAKAALQAPNSSTA